MEDITTSKLYRTEMCKDGVYCKNKDACPHAHQKMDLRPVEEEAKKPQKSYETYKRVKTLKSGAFGKAILCEAESDLSKVVIKEIDIRGQDEQKRKETLKESKILEVLNHPNVVRFREVYKTRGGKLCIV